MIFEIQTKQLFSNPLKSQSHLIGLKNNLTLIKFADYRFSKSSWLYRGIVFYFKQLIMKMAINIKMKSYFDV